MILCETIHRIHNTANFDVLNTFHFLAVNQFPCKFPKITVWFTLTDGHGTYNLSLCLVQASTGNEIKRWTEPHTVTDPLAIGDMIMVLRGVPFPQPGKYVFELRCNDEIISQRPFFIRMMREPNPPEQGWSVSG
jgi:hypothetical protein